MKTWGQIILLNKKLTNWTNRLVDSDNTNVGFISHESRQPQPSPRKIETKKIGTHIEARCVESSKLPLGEAPHQAPPSQYVQLLQERPRKIRGLVSKTRSNSRNTLAHFHSHLKTSCAVAVTRGFSKKSPKKEVLSSGKSPCYAGWTWPIIYCLQNSRLNNELLISSIERVHNSST